MYNENSNFSIKNVIVQFLFVALFVFILVWLFPLKSDLSKLKVTTNKDDNNALTVLVDRIFNENVIAMKDAAKSYYTLERLPQNVGDKVKMTLGEMLEKKIILPFTDKNGDTCDLKESYVEVTKYDTEYLMKVNLKCGDEENYLLVYMGCYDYCSTTVCEKNKSDVKAPVVYSKKTNQPAATSSNPTPSNPTPSNPTPSNPDPQPTPVNPDPQPTPDDPTPTPTPQKEYIYEYKKVTNGYYTETDWSDWSTNKVTADANTAVQTKTVTSKKLVGYNVTTGYDYSKPIYGTKTVETGAYEEKQVCVAYDYVPTGEYSYSAWNYVGDVYLTYSPSDTDTVKYVWVDDSNWVCQGNCSSGTTHKYQKYTRTTTPITRYQCTKYETQRTPVTTTVKTITGYETKVISKTPVYKETTTTYYRYKTRTYHPGTTDLKWSVYNDTTLLNSGYSYTGNKKVK